MCWERYFECVPGVREALRDRVLMCPSALCLFMPQDDRCKTPLSMLASLMPASAVPAFRCPPLSPACRSHTQPRPSTSSPQSCSPSPTAGRPGVRLPTPGWPRDLERDHGN